MENNNYDILKSISIEEVKSYFHLGAFNSLVKCGILTLGDLFEKVSTKEFQRTLIYSIPVMKIRRTELLNEVLGTVNVLRCKYLNENPLISKKDELDKIYSKLGLSNTDYEKLKKLHIINLGELLEMVEKNNFRLLHNYQYRKDYIKVLIDKLKVIYNYYNPDKKTSINERNDEEELKKKLEKYEQLKSVPLQAEINFFHGTTFKTLVNTYGINTLGDLLIKQATGELSKTIYQTGRSYCKDEQHRMLLAIINILKCKYLNEDPKMDENTSLQELVMKMGLSFNDRNSMRDLGINNLGQLFEMYENGSIYRLYALPSWGDVKFNNFLMKLKIVYNYHNSQKSKMINEIPLGKVQAKKLCEFTNEEIRDLADKLKSLIQERNRLDEEIKSLQATIDKKMPMVKKRK